MREEKIGFMIEAKYASGWKPYQKREGMLSFIPVYLQKPTAERVRLAFFKELKSGNTDWLDEEVRVVPIVGLKRTKREQ